MKSENLKWNQHLSKMNRNKARGSDEIVIETRAALNDFGIDNTTEIINVTYHNEDITGSL